MLCVFYHKFKIWGKKRKQVEMLEWIVAMGAREMQGRGGSSPGGCCPWSEMWQRDADEDGGSSTASSGTEVLQLVSFWCLVGKTAGSHSGLRSEVEKPLPGVTWVQSTSPTQSPGLRVLESRAWVSSPGLPTALPAPHLCWSGPCFWLFSKEKDPHSWSLESPFPHPSTIALQTFSGQGLLTACLSLCHHSCQLSAQERSPDQVM